MLPRALQLFLHHRWASLQSRQNQHGANQAAWGRNRRLWGNQTCATPSQLFTGAKHLGWRNTAHLPACIYLHIDKTFFFFIIKAWGPTRTGGTQGLFPPQALAQKESLPWTSSTPGYCDLLPFSGHDSCWGPEELSLFIAQSTEREMLICSSLSLQKKGGDGPSSNAPLQLMRRGAVGKKEELNAGGSCCSSSRPAACSCVLANSLNSRKRETLCKAALRQDIINKLTLQQ